MELHDLAKRLGIPNLSMKIILMAMILTTLHLECTSSFGYDSANACTPNGKISRRGRAQMLAAIPCDLTQQVFCHLPGPAYPWHAVRRFVHENQGLMKRMYGDVRHISILRDEIQNNEIDIDDFEVAADRYTKDNPNRRAGKYMAHSREDYLLNNKGNDVITEPHFRPVSSTTAPKTSSVPITTSTPSPLEDSTQITTTIADTVDRPSSVETINTNASVTNHSNQLPIGAEKYINNENNVPGTESGTMNIESNSVYENAALPTASDMNLGDNIQVIDSPQLGLHNISNSQSGLISTTLKVVTTMKTAPVSTRRTQYMTIRRRPVVHSKPQSHNAPTHLSQMNTTMVAKNVTNAGLRLRKNETVHPTSTAPSSKLFSSTVATTSTSVTNDSIPILNDIIIENVPINTKESSTSKEPITVASTHKTTTTTTFNSVKSMTDEKPTRKPINTSQNLKLVATTPATTTKKPVLRDGQLFQDTVKQEIPPVSNMRGVNACPVKEEVVAPFWANNTRGEVLALLNLYPFEQYVHWEKCTHELKQMYCRDGCRCEQQYRLHRLLAYDPHNECRGIFSDWFRFPSSCICKCYDILIDFRATSRSPRADTSYTNAADVRKATSQQQKDPIDIAEEEVKRAIYEHATEHWYRPRDESDFDDD